MTYTPTINAAGKLVEQHVLFSKLKNVPGRVANGITVNVNWTGMWSKEITKEWFERVIFTNACCSAFSNEWTLVIMDSFPGHVALLGDETFLRILERKRIKGKKNSLI